MVSLCLSVRVCVLYLLFIPVKIRPCPKLSVDPSVGHAFASKSSSCYSRIYRWILMALQALVALPSLPPYHRWLITFWYRRKSESSSMRTSKKAFLWSLLSHVSAVFDRRKHISKMKSCFLFILLPLSIPLSSLPDKIPLTLLWYFIASCLAGINPCLIFKKPSKRYRFFSRFGMIMTI